MIKRIVIPTIFAALLISAASCTKCTSCSVFDSNGNTIVENNESCGNKDDIERAERQARDEASLLGGTYECIEQD